jgi:tetratricopeptide (TPR) repeat protein
LLNAATYQTPGNPLKAIYDYKKILENCRKAKKIHYTHVFTLLNLADLYIGLEKYDEARLYLEEGIHIAEKNQWVRLIAACDLCLGDMFSKSGEANNAYLHLQKARRFFEANQDQEGLSRLQVPLARWEILYGDVHKGYRLCQQAGQNLWEKQTWVLTDDALWTLCVAIERMQQHESLLRHLGMWQHFMEKIQVSITDGCAVILKQYRAQCQEALGELAEHFWQEGYNIPFEKIPQVAFQRADK